MVFEEILQDGTIKRSISSPNASWKKVIKGTKRCLDFYDALQEGDFYKIEQMLAKKPEELNEIVSINFEGHSVLYPENHTPMMHLLCEEMEQAQPNPENHTPLGESLFDGVITGPGGSEREKKDFKTMEYMAKVNRNNMYEYKEKQRVSAVNQKRTKEIIDILEFVLSHGGRVASEGYKLDNINDPEIKDFLIKSRNEERLPGRLNLTDREIDDISNPKIKDYVIKARNIDREVLKIMDDYGCKLEDKANQKYFQDATLRCRTSGLPVEESVAYIKAEVEKAVGGEQE